MRENRQGKVFRDPQTGAEWALRFEEAFPSISDVRVDVVEEGPGNEGLGARFFVKQAIREYINCSNPDCSGQGYGLGRQLHRMVESGLTEHSEARRCEGQLERSGSPCPNTFEIQIRVRFHSR